MDGDYSYIDDIYVLNCPLYSHFRTSGISIISCDGSLLYVTCNSQILQQLHAHIECLSLR